MTVPATIPSISYVYSGVGDYDFPFLVYDEDTVRVVHVNTDGVTTSLAYITDFSVELNETTEGGTVTIINEDISGGSITIRRTLDIIQEIDWVNNSRFDMEVLERAFDRVTMILQQQEIIVTEASTVTNFRSDWAGPGVSYATSDIVVAGEGNWYVCVVAHTSTGNFATDLANGYWLLAMDISSILIYRDEAQAAATSATASALSCSNDAATVSDLAEDCADHEAASADNAQSAANCAQAAYDDAERAEGYANDTGAISSVNKSATINCTGLSTQALDCATYDTFTLTNVDTTIEFDITSLVEGRTVVICFVGTVTGAVTFSGAYGVEKVSSFEFTDDDDLMTLTHFNARILASLGRGYS